MSKKTVSSTHVLADSRLLTYEEFRSRWNLSENAAKLVYDRLHSFVSDTGGFPTCRIDDDGTLLATAERWEIAAEGAIWQAENETKPFLFQCNGGLACPCGSSAIHIGPIQVELGTITVVAIHDEVHALPHTEPSNRRGSAVTIAIACEECGGVSEIRLQQHKASVFADVELNENADFMEMPQLWRD